MKPQRVVVGVAALIVALVATVLVVSAAGVQQSAGVDGAVEELLLGKLEAKTGLQLDWVPRGSVKAGASQKGFSGSGATGDEGDFFPWAFSSNGSTTILLVFYPGVTETHVLFGAAEPIEKECDAGECGAIWQFEGTAAYDVIRLDGVVRWLLEVRTTSAQDWLGADLGVDTEGGLADVYTLAVDVRSRSLFYGPAFTRQRVFLADEGYAVDVCGNSRGQSPFLETVAGETGRVCAYRFVWQYGPEVPPQVPGTADLKVWSLWGYVDTPRAGAAPSSSQVANLSELAVSSTDFTAFSVSAGSVVTYTFYPGQRVALVFGVQNDGPEVAGAVHLTRTLLGWETWPDMTTDLGNVEVGYSRAWAIWSYYQIPSSAQAGRYEVVFSAGSSNTPDPNTADNVTTVVLMVEYRRVYLPIVVK